MSRLYTSFLLAISLCFVVGGLFMIRSGSDVGWVSTLFFGACAATFVWQLWPRTLEREQRSVGEILANFPREVELRTSLLKVAFLTAVSVVFAGSMVWIVRTEDVSPLIFYILWGGIIFIGGGFPLWLLAQLMGRSLYLRRDGFEVVRGWKRNAVLWRNTSEFSIASVGGGTPLIVYDNAAVEGRTISRVNREITGRNAALPDSYGMTHDDLTALMNAWRSRALTGRGY